MIFVVASISLVDQTVAAFMDEGIWPIGVIQADHPMTDPSRAVQIASVQTLARRPRIQADFASVDEADIGSDFIRKWMQSEPQPLFIGLSATPWRKGMANEYDDLVIVVTVAELIDANILADFIAFAPSHPDLTAVKSTAGDFDPDQLSEVMSKIQMVADVVTTWLEKAENRSTFCSPVDRAHAKSLQAAFAAGNVTCGYIDTNTDPIERNFIRERFRSGEIRVVCNCPIPDDHISPRRSAFFMASSVLRDIRNGVRPC